MELITPYGTLTLTLNGEERTLLEVPEGCRLRIREAEGLTLVVDLIGPEKDWANELGNYPLDTCNHIWLLGVLSGMWMRRTIWFSSSQRARFAASFRASCDLTSPRSTFVSVGLVA